jgi:hypothetical protein
MALRSIGLVLLGVSFGCADIAGAQVLEVLNDEARQLLVRTAPMLPYNNARQLIERTIERQPNHGVNTKDPDFHALIHIVDWTLKDGEAVVKAEQWSTFREGPWSNSRFGGTRVLGSQNVVLLTVHFGLDCAQRAALRYAISFEEKTAAPLIHLGQLIRAIVQQPTDEALAIEDCAGGMWGWMPIRIDSLPGDINVIPQMLDATKEVMKFGSEKVFDNEGLYRYDFSLAVPINGAEDLTFAEGAVTPTEVDKQTAYGAAMWYLKPVDVKAPGPTLTPYLFAGFALENKFYQRGIVGVGWGPIVANFFAGAAWQYVEDDAVAEAAGKRWNWNFAFGVNVPIRALLDKATK